MNMDAGLGMKGELKIRVIRARSTRWQRFLDRLRGIA